MEKLYRLEVRECATSYIMEINTFNVSEAVDKNCDV